MSTWLLAGVALIERFAWLGVKGFQRSYDSGFYLRAADAVLADGLIHTLTSMRGAWKYSASISIFSALRAAFGELAVEAWIMLGIVASSLALIPLFLLARELFDARAATIACVLYLGCFDVLQWTSFALTDTLFLSATIVFVWLAVRARATRSRAAAALAIGMGAVVATMRIAGMVFVATTLLWLVVIAIEARWGGWSARARKVATVAIVSGFVLMTVVGIGAIGVLNPHIADYVASGAVIDDDPSTTLALHVRPYEAESLLSFLVANPVEGAKVLFVKMGAFWVAFLPRYSVGHNLVNAITLAPIVLLGLGTVARVAAERPTVEGRRLLVLLVPIITIFHALTLIDYDLRYRAPALPLLAVFAAVPIRWFLARVPWPWQRPAWVP